MKTNGNAGSWSSTKKKDGKAGGTQGASEGGVRRGSSKRIRREVLSEREGAVKPGAGSFSGTRKGSDHKRRPANKRRFERGGL